MLQQTTVATVTPRFRIFIARFPSIEVLAAAPLDDVLHAWQGLGYYRRARLLHRCAAAVVERHGGKLPDEVAELRELPGLGAYTANAVAAIAFGRPVVPVDGNVERVLARLDALPAPPKTIMPQVRAAASRFEAEERASDCAQALMELGAMICRPRQPVCALCPLQQNCEAHRQGLVEQIPVRPMKSARPERHAVAFVLHHADRGVLFRRRPEEGLLGGMVELPSTPWLEAPLEPEDWHKAAPVPALEWHALGGSVRHVFTHFALNLEMVRAETGGLPRPDPIDGFWCRPERFASLALPTLTRKLLRHARLTP